MSIVLGNGVNNTSPMQDAQGMCSHSQRNHLEHVHNIDRISLMECLNEKDENGNIIIPSVDVLYDGIFSKGEIEQYKKEFERQERIKKNVDLVFQKKQLTEKTVTFYAEMGIEAARRFSGVGGGWRLYVIAKSLDTNGRGMVKRDELESFILELGIDKRTFYRWIDQARRYDLVIDVQSVSGDWMLRLPNAGKAAASLGCQRLSRKVALPITALIGKGWKARVNGAFMAMFNGKPIARETIQKNYNIPQSTQRYRDASAKVTRIKNIAELGEVENSRETIELLQAAKREGLYHGEYVKGGKLYRRLPNTYQFTTALRGGRGRARKANKIINMQQQQNGLLQKQQALSDDVAQDFVRLYNMTEAQTKRTVKRIDEKGIKLQSVYELKDHTYKERGGVVLWTPVLVGAL